jgi:nitric oxide dioxygenase
MYVLCALLNKHVKYIFKITNHDCYCNIHIIFGEANGALAGIFVDTEEAIYKINEEKEGGWRGDRAFEICEIVDEAFEVKSFYLKAKDGKSIATWEPDQYVGVKVTPDTSEYTEIRQYSVSNAPNNDIYRLTIRLTKSTQTQ